MQGKIDRQKESGKPGKWVQEDFEELRDEWYKKKLSERKRIQDKGKEWYDRETKAHFAITAKDNKKDIQATTPLSLLLATTMEAFSTETPKLLMPGREGVIFRLSLKLRD